MKVVLDSNVWLSALISPYGPPDVIYRAWRAAKFEIVTSHIQLEEIKRASRYSKFKDILQPYRVGTMINNLQRAIVLERFKIRFETNDPNDDYLLAMAVAGEADYLVTGDHRAGMLKQAKCHQTRIVAPSYFCKKVLS